MKSTVGPIPEDAHFQPDGDVWTIVRGPIPEKMMLLSLPLLVLFGLGTILLQGPATRLVSDFVCLEGLVPTSASRD